MKYDDPQQGITFSITTDGIAADATRAQVLKGELDWEAIDRHRASLERKAGIAEGLADIAAGRTVSLEDWKRSSGHVGAARPLAPLAAFLISAARMLIIEPREGAAIDEPEGARFIRLSDTSANALATELQLGAVTADPFALDDDQFHAYANLVADEVVRRRQHRDAQRITLR